MGNNARDQFAPVPNVGPNDYANNRWYLAGEYYLGAAGNTLSINSIRMYPFEIRSLVDITQLGTRVNVPGAGLLQLAIYKANQITLRPENIPVAQTGDLDASVAQNVAGPIVQGRVTLPPGVYWFATNNNVGGISAQAGGSSVSYYGWLVGSVSQDIIASTSAVGIATLAVPAVYGTWPDMSLPASIAAFTEVANQSFALGQFFVP